MKGSHPEAEVISHSISLSVHGGLENGMSGSEFVKTYVNPPPATLGPASLRTFAYHFPGEGKLLSSSVLAEPSAIHPGAIFARINLTLEGRETSVADAFATARAYWDKVAAAFGVDVKDGSDVAN